MTFKSAKNTIRAALRECPDSKLAELLDAARAGKVPYTNSRICLATRIHGDWLDGIPGMGSPTPEYNNLEAAYLWLPKGRLYPFEGYDAVGQRILIPMILAEIRRRHRVALTAKVTEAVSCG